MTITPKQRASFDSKRQQVRSELSEMAATYRTHSGSVYMAVKAEILLNHLEYVGSRYTVALSSVGNPDHGQFCGRDNLSPTIILSADTLPEIVQCCRSYIELYDLGGGNCPNFPVLENGKRFGTVSFNSRIWGLDGREVNPSQKEVAA